MTSYFPIFAGIFEAILMQVQNLEPLQVAKHLAKCWQSTERGGKGRVPLTEAIVLRTQCHCNSFLRQRLRLTSTYKSWGDEWLKFASAATWFTHFLSTESERVLLPQGLQQLSESLTSTRTCRRCATPTQHCWITDSC